MIPDVIRLLFKFFTKGGRNDPSEFVVPFTATQRYALQTGTQRSLEIPGTSFFSLLFFLHSSDLSACAYTGAHCL